jgi:bifunctional isochorismate lyase/aryl carrier protein
VKQDFILDIKKACLLVIDMQKYFCDDDGKAYVPEAGRIKDQIQSLIDVFSAVDQPIIFTRHLDSEHGLMRKWWRENLEKEDPQSMITSDLDTGRGQILEKHQYDAFHDTDLEKILRKKHVEQVVICGVLTNLCCESTARSAFIKGFEVYFVEDATGTYKKEMHQATIMNLAYGFAVMLKTSDIKDTNT